MKKGTYKDITGQKFYRLTAIKREGTTPHGESKWLCKCDCGKEVVVRHGALTSGNTKSCGCWNKENLKIINKKHGDSCTRLYKIWSGMKKRCYTKTDKNYLLYGGRGIKVCDDWKTDYLKFKEWALSNGYADSLTLDRKDSNGNYEPDNCQWSGLIKQANNKRSNIIFEINGEKHTMAEWCKIKGISYRMVKTRYSDGWDPRDLFKPCGAKREYPLLHESKRKGR